MGREGDKLNAGPQDCLGAASSQAPSLPSETLQGDELDSRCMGNLYSPAQAVEGSKGQWRGQMCAEREEHKEKVTILELTS